MTQLKLPHSVIVRAPALLPMLYKVSEISQLMGVPDRTLRDWLAIHGAPYIRDKRQHIWINGIHFAGWVNTIRKKKSGEKIPMDVDEAYCMRCNQPVKLLQPVMKPVQGRLVLLQGKCPQCGTTVNRGGGMPQPSTRDKE